MADSRIEQLLEALLNGDTVDIVPQSRNEELLLAMINGEKPTGSPHSRMEAYFHALAEKGMGGGSGGETGGGDNPLDYALAITELFMYSTFPINTDLVVSFGGAYQDTIRSTALVSTFNGTNNLKSIKIKCGLSGKTSMNRAFIGVWGESVLTKIDLSEMVQPILPTDMALTFQRRTKLVEILGEFDASNCTTFNNTFGDCAALQTIRFAKGTIKVSISFGSSPNLTDATIQNIIDGLADLTGGTAQSVGFHSTVLAKLTEEQSATILAKNWTV